MKALTLADLGFLYTETVSSPKHVAGLQIFSPPVGYQGNFTRDLFERLMAQSDVKSPFNLMAKKQCSGLFHWQEDTDIDLSYHLRFISLESTDREAQLLTFVEHQHEILLDRNRPLWEMTLIDGLEDKHFAVYIKFHHAFADGIRSTQLMMSFLSDTPRAPLTALWSAEQPEQKNRIDSLFLTISKETANQIKSIPPLSKLTTQLLFQAANIYKADMPTPFTAPKTPFSISPAARRKIAISSLPLMSVKTLGTITGATINDVVVTICDMAIHRYLSSHNFAINKPLVAEIPVSVRSEADTTTRNKIVISQVELAESPLPPLERLMKIKDSCRKLKNRVDLLSETAFTNYTLASQGVAVICELLRLDTLLPPLGNVLISNVPGPAMPLYIMGAKMEKCIPLSALPPGISLNITFYSYSGLINIGLVSCRKALPELAELAEYIRDAFFELEKNVLECAAAIVSEKVATLQPNNLASEMQ